MHPPIELFEYCPKCGSHGTPGQNPFSCSSCSFSFFFNPTVAAAALVFDESGKALFIRRLKDPAMGKFGLPGGFLDFGESAEEGLRREVREEVNLEIDSIQFLCSCPNFYPYRGVVYPVCDLIFSAKATNPEAVQALDGVEKYEWLNPLDVDETEIAFPSIRAGIAALKL